MADQPLEEDDKNALANLDSAPSPRNKAQSYSHQLRTNTGTNIKRHHPQIRKHSLDDNAIKTNIDAFYDSSDDDFYPYATTSDGGGDPAGSATVMGGSGHFEYHPTAAEGAEQPQQQQPLPEFMGNDSNAPAIFKTPTRAAVHPNRPSCLELRPHPLRETQVGRFLRTIACTETQLWAGQESGVRVWNLTDAYQPGIGIGGRARRGDEDAAPFYESANTSPAICMMIDGGSKLVWSGHKDGKIRSWKMDQAMDDTPFKEGLSWQAHRGPVLSMAISAYGNHQCLVIWKESGREMKGK